MKRNLGDCAVVLGGSVAGLLAARVLAERFATVVVVERDRLPNGPEPRRGVPQGKHIHGLLAGGQQAIEQLLPGLTKELAADGVPVGDPLADVRLCLNGHHFRQATQRVDPGERESRRARTPGPTPDPVTAGDQSHRSVRRRGPRGGRRADHRCPGAPPCR